MSTTTPPAHIDFPIDVRQKDVIAQAAMLLGLDIGQFIIERVFPEAERIVAEDNRTRLSHEDWAIFAAKLDEAPKDLPELRRLLQESSIFVKS